MTCPVTWSKNPSFHPIGNTTPVCLTQNLSHEKSADVLLLDCGDPRSILYTVYADLADGNRPMDFTCCDMEPAVLARNILLLTMIVDGIATDVAWSIFYHFFLDEPSHNTLITQCRILIECSSDMKTWKASKYSYFLRFCTAHSLSEIRRHWVLYAQSEDLSQTEHEEWKASFHAEMKEVSREPRAEHIIAPMRAAGPLVYSIGRAAYRSYHSYWNTGVTTSMSSRTVATPYVNPTFAYSASGKKFSVHSDTNPVIAFFLAPAVVYKKGHNPSTSVEEELVDCAKSQFSSWCSAFRTRLSATSTANIVIRFFVGDSLALCQALNICKEQKTVETGVYAHSWGSTTIVLDFDDYCPSTSTPAPLLFNVIDTSNLVDGAGVLNLLVATVPLLDRTPWSILHTHTIIGQDHDGPEKSKFAKSACADIPTISILLGVSPSPYLYHFTTHSNKHDILVTKPFSSGRIRESISWRFVSAFLPNAVPSPRDSHLGHFALVCDPETLARFFFSVYQRMFDDEDYLKYTRTNFDPAAARDLALRTVYYIRTSLVTFLAAVKRNVRVDWENTMEHLLGLILNDPILLTNVPSYPDLICQMHMHNVYTDETLTSAFLETLRSPLDRFHGWKEVSPVVCIMLEVPRFRLKRLEDMHPDKMMATMLECELVGEEHYNIYSSIQFTFGEIGVDVIDGEPHFTVNEDLKGWNGNSSLIATFHVPSFVLTLEPTTTQVLLLFRTTVAARYLVPLLGDDLEVFSASLADTTYVHVARHRPNNVHEIERLGGTPTSDTQQTALHDIRDIILKFDPSDKKATQLVVRKDITDPVASQSLANGAKVSLTPVADTSVLVTFEGYTHCFLYPFPLQSKYLRPRIVRKSSYVEVHAPIRHAFGDFRHISLNPFPVAYEDGQINILNVHYINLDILPSLSLPADEDDVDWVDTHVGTMFSQDEKRRNENQKEYRTIVNVKQNIRLMLVSHAGLRPPGRPTMYGLAGPHDRFAVHTLIFINAIKLDLSSHTVVIDACVVPLVNEATRALSRELINDKNTLVGGCYTGEEEMRAWNLLLPVLSERCRTWQHTDTCEYRARGIPASLDASERSPLCSCGKGKNLGEFGTISKWAGFHSEATRIAICPFFMFTFLEDVSNFVKDTPYPNKRGPKCAQCGAPGKPKLLVCAACLKARYCSPQCQRAHWKFHKRQCAGSK